MTGSAPKAASFTLKKWPSVGAASKRRLQRRLGALGKDDMEAIGRAVCLQLGL